MNKKCKTFEELTSGAADYLTSKLLRAEGTAKYYHCQWRKVKRYMKSKRIKHFDSTVGKEYLLQQFGNRDYCKLSKTEKDLLKAVNVLCEFYETGAIQAVKTQTSFEGTIGKIMREFLSYKQSFRLKMHTMDEQEQYLYRFLCFLNENKITSLEAISQLHILKFIKTINPRFSTLTHLILRVLRGFFRYIYDQHLLAIDLSCLIPKDNYKKQAKLPSTYSPEEIEKMIATIDRGNATGKRNYAIVIIAAKLGLRACDIANLKFENILWEQSTIVLNQYKTGKKIELPMLSEVGNAIIDYLKYGRPKSNEPFVFLLSRSPFTPIHSGSITEMVQSSFAQAGINIENRKHGPHALRHSLAGILLERETALPVISEVLGHENTESTRYYLRIDLKSLKQCALEVPAVSTSFYNQNGGYFYA